MRGGGCTIGGHTNGVNGRQVARPRLEVADIFHYHGVAWRQANARQVSLKQSKVMSAIKRCRTAEAGGHVTRCECLSAVDWSQATDHRFLLVGVLIGLGAAPNAKPRFRARIAAILSFPMAIAS